MATAPKSALSDYRRAAPVVLDTALASPCNAFYVGTSGNVTVRFAGDNGTGGADVTLKGLTAGRIYHSMSVAIFRASGATAADIVALYR
jgi:hypothetical protein